MTISNPGNVKNNPSNRWKGSPSEDSRGLAIFQELEGRSAQAWGVRAMVRTLERKTKAGKRSLMEIISEWAPKDDGNDPVMYANEVARWIGVAVGMDMCIFGDHGEVLKYDRLIGLVAAIAIYENGHDYKLQAAVILDGIELYLKTWCPE